MHFLDKSAHLLHCLHSVGYIVETSLFHCATLWYIHTRLRRAKTWVKIA